MKKKVNKSEEEKLENFKKSLKEHQPIVYDLIFAPKIKVSSKTPVSINNYYGVGIEGLKEKPYRLEIIIDCKNPENNSLIIEAYGTDKNGKVFVSDFTPTMEDYSVIKNVNINLCLKNVTLKTTTLGKL